MAKKTAAQKKADKAFIEKIGTIGIGTGSSKEKTCPDCGHELKPIGMLVGEMHGQPVGGPVYGHPGTPSRSRAERPVEQTDEQSLSA